MKSIPLGTITSNDAQSLINKKVRTASGVRFTSGKKYHTVKEVIQNPITFEPAFTFYEDNSFVDIVNCARLKSNKQKKKTRERHVTINCGDDGHDSADYDLSVTKDVRGGIGQTWDQRIKMTYGHISNWTEHTKGTLAATLKDGGDSIIVDIGDNHIELDYSEIQQLYVLLMYYNDFSKLDPNTQEIFFHKTPYNKSPKI